MQPAVDREPDPIPTASVPVWALVIADMHARDQAGREKYGTPLQADNGRDHLVDAYQEALDLCVYLRAAIAKRKGHGWQPIETAPKDGRWVILYSPSGGVECGYWGPTEAMRHYDDDERCYDWVQYSCGSEAETITGGVPTHWMPLPEPPGKDGDA